jgi:hypothetical protein
MLRATSREPDPPKIVHDDVVRPLGGVVCPDTPILGSLGVSTDVHGQCCGVQGAAGLELDEQAPVAGCGELGVEG